MGLERRGNSTYYYLKERDGDRVLSRYMGVGRNAELFMQLSELHRDEGDYKRWERNEERRQQKEAEQRVIKIEREVRDLLSIVLRANGYHQHKGQWRKRRGSKRDGQALEERCR